MSAHRTRSRRTSSPPEPEAAAGDWGHRREVLALLRGYRQAQVLMACVELGVFEALAAGPQPAEALASTLGADPRGLALLLNAATALDLLTRRGEAYANAPVAEACLAGSGPHYLGNLARRERAFYRRWSHLTEAVRTGQRPEDNARDEAAGDWVRDFELALYDLARALGPLIAEALALPEDRPLRVLDVGGGHGGYSLALARRYPRLSATVFELPRVVPVARELIAAEGLEARVQVCEGDFRHDPLGSGYDVVLLFGVLAGETPEGRASLIRKAHAALNPGGLVAVRELLLDPDGTGPPEAALFALQMLLATDAGGATTTQQLAGWLAEAGFTRLQPLTLPAWTGTQLITAEKP